MALDHGESCTPQNEPYCLRRASLASRSAFKSLRLQKEFCRIHSIALANQGISVTVGFHLRQADFVTTIRSSYQNARGMLLVYVIISNRGEQRCIQCFGEETCGKETT